MIVAALLNYRQKAQDTAHLFPKEITKKVTIDKQGIGAACNRALKIAFVDFNADYCLILANDIVEPSNSIEARLKAFKTHNAGIVTIPTDGPKPTFHRYLAGNFMIKREVWEKIGYFTTKYDQSYGPVDLDYTVRATSAGFNCVNAKADANHLDNGDTAYGFSKQEALKITWQEFKDWERNLDKSCIFVPYT